MKKWGTVGVAIVACGVLAGCKGSKTPSGQVVATVGNTEITTRQLAAEMSGARSADPKQQKFAQDAALRNLVGRTVIANAARKEGIDKKPDFVLAKDRAIDSMLAQAYQQKIASAVPAATPDDAKRFMDANPDMFAQRKIWTVDQLRMPRPNDQNLLKALAPLTTFEAIQALLTSQKVPFQRGTAQLDAATADPRLVQAVLKLKPGELFVLPADQLITVNNITDTKVMPFVGPQASSYAQKMVMRDRTQDAIRRAFQQEFAKAGKSIKFGKDYQSANPMFGQPAPAKAAPGAPPATHAPG